MAFPLPLANVRDEEVRFALERLSAGLTPLSDIAGNGLVRVGDTLNVGQGYGIIVGADTVAVDPSIIPSSATLWANLKDDYGAVGDGNAATGTGTDDLGAMNAAIADLNNNVIDVLFIPGSCYILSNVPNVITASDYLIFGAGPATMLRMQSTAAHGTFFTCGATGGAGSSRGAICDLAVRCNVSSNTPPNTENAFHLIKGGTTFVRNILATDIGGLCTIGSTDTNDRMQLYGFQNVFGNWNSVTSAPSRIHIINGTDGRYEDIRLTADEVNGGYGVHADPTSRGVDQHYFSKCEIWSEGSYSHNLGHGTTYNGITWNAYLDFTNGQIFNWVFDQCVFDEGRSGAVYITASSGNNVCKEIHFLDCHFETNAGNGLRINHQGSGPMVDIAVIEGRIRMKGDPAIKITDSGSGAPNLTGFHANGVACLQEQISYTSANTVRDSIVHTFKHGLAVDDAIQFSGSPPAPLAAATTYYVKNADANSDGLEFTLSATTPAGAGATINITATAVGTYRVNTAACIQITGSRGVRVTGCYFGTFEGVAASRVAYAVQGTGGGESLYNITGNVARGMVTGFANGLSTTAGPPTTSIVENNVSDV